MTTRKPTRPRRLSNTIPSYDWRNNLQYKKENRGWLKKSAGVAVLLLDVLDNRKMSQSELAVKLKVSRQQVSKILKGQENLTLETLAKLESVLGTELIKISNETK